MDPKILFGIVGLVFSGILVIGQVRVSVIKAKTANSLAAGTATDDEKKALNDLLLKLADSVPLGVLAVLFFGASALLIGIKTLNWGV